LKAVFDRLGKVYGVLSSAAIVDVSFEQFKGIGSIFACVHGDMARTVNIKSQHTKKTT